MSVAVVAPQQVSNIGNRLFLEAMNNEYVPASTTEGPRLGYGRLDLFSAR